MEEQGSSLAGSDDSKILIPYTTAQRATGQKNVTTFYAKATSEASVSLAGNTIDAYLLQATRDEDAYTVSNQSDLLDTMDEGGQHPVPALRGASPPSPCWWGA